MSPTRRTVINTIAWSTPVIAFAVASPAASASTLPPPALDLCQSGGLLFVGIEAESQIKGNDGNGFTLVKGDGIVAINRSGTQLALPVTLWTSAGQVGLQVDDDAPIATAKDGNKATTTLIIPVDGSVELRIIQSDSGAQSHLVIDCGRFLFKSTKEK